MQIPTRVIPFCLSSPLGAISSARGMCFVETLCTVPVLSQRHLYPSLAGSWGPVLPGGGWHGAVKPHWGSRSAIGPPGMASVPQGCSIPQGCHRSLLEMLSVPPRDAISPSGKPSASPGMLLYPQGCHHCIPWGRFAFGPSGEGVTPNPGVRGGRDGSLLHPLTD